LLVLLWGLSTEGPLAAVREELLRIGVPTYTVDQHAVLDTEVRLGVGREVEGAVRAAGDEWIDLSEVSAVYVRPYDSRRVPAVKRESPGSDASRHALAVDHAMTCWSEMTFALVVNRFQAMASNNSKPYQLQKIRAAGFDVPETLLTTDPGAVQAFWERHGEVIYKSISGTRSRVVRLRHEQRERLANVAFCPTQFQRYIPGTDVRVHVVGAEVFASEIVSEADDYRYPGRHAVDIHARRLPGEVEERCRLLARALRLPVAGIDLRRTPEADWYCFEVNPSPAFTFYERMTGQPIGRAVANLLAAGAQGLNLWDSGSFGRHSSVIHPGFIAAGYSGGPHDEPSGEVRGGHLGREGVPQAATGRGFRAEGLEQKNDSAEE
jgi:glutathione synthase/RimK-type ligase-like ATP-grasp enzyme